MEEVRIADWPEPPGSNAWLPAYGFPHDILEKDDFFGANGDNGSNHALYLETIVEETSDDLRSERSSAATWLSDSDADSVIHVRGNGGSECDSESEREWACPAKRRRRERAPSPASTASLSRSSSLAQFESLERSCAAPTSPSLSPDSLDSPPASPPPAHRPPAPRTHLSAENLSEDSGYSERPRRPPPPSQRRPPEIAHRPPAAGSEPCLTSSPSAERRPARAARALSLPAELDVCADAEPRRHRVSHAARFRQTFEVSDNLTVSVADLTALDYRGGSRRPRHPPPPPPPRIPPPPPPQPAPPSVTRRHATPIREPSAGSDSTTESERAFVDEMEATARRLDESAKRALAHSGHYDRELSAMTARRLRDSWGAWDDVLDELRRRVEPASATPSPPRTPSPDPVREPVFSSTPLRAGDARVRSTPELRARGMTPNRETPDELRASLQLETDVDTQRTVLHARSLLALPPPDERAPRPHKSMEFLLDKESAQTVQPPENELQKNSDRVLSEHELRVQRSLQKLNVPEWYKNAPVPREGFLLRKRLSDASASAARWSGLNSKTTSLGSLGGANAQPPPPQLSPHTTSFGRWSTNRLNSSQTSPCSSTRSSLRGTSPLCSPSTRSSFSARQPYLGWRSQERLNNAPRTPHERLASSLLHNSPTPSKASEEIQTSIKEVTSAIVHYVSGLEPANGDIDRQPSPRSSQKLYWLESSFVGTKPLESPQTPLVVSEALPPPHPRPPSSLRLEHRAAPAPAPGERA